MIEVEKKFLFSSEEKERLLNGAIFISQKIFTDVYFDNNDYSLTKNDNWLRSRNGKFEYKVSLAQGATRLAEQYDEIEDEEKIKSLLNLPPDQTMFDSLPANGYFPFCTCKTIRNKYNKTGFTIDVDEVSYSDKDYIYNICEIELLVNQRLEMKTAVEKIIEFAQENKLAIKNVPGKVLIYLKKFKPDHYQLLVEAKVIKDDKT